MRIEYETTLDDIADVHLRMAQRSRLAQRARWQGALWIVVLTSVILLLWLLHLGVPLAERCAISAFGAIGSAGGYWLNYHRSMKRRILKHLREQMHTDGPLHFAVELREDCIWTKLATTQLSFDWMNLQEIIDTPDWVELRMRDGSFVIVRSRGFPSQEAREQFKKIANTNLNRISKPPFHSGFENG